MRLCRYCGRRPQAPVRRLLWEVIMKLYALTVGLSLALYGARGARHGQTDRRLIPRFIALAALLAYAINQLP